MVGDKEDLAMQKVECISKRPTNYALEVGVKYYIDQLSIFGLEDGDWYADVYRIDSARCTWLGRFNLNHFKTCK